MDVCMTFRCVSVQIRDDSVNAIATEGSDYLRGKDSFIWRDYAKRI